MKLTLPCSMVVLRLRLGTAPRGALP
jgi:hypothetical protein